MSVVGQVRLTATPNCGGGMSPAAMTVWVEPNRLWLRPACPVENADSYDREGWARLTEAGWERLRDCVDRYFAVQRERAGKTNGGAK